MQFSVITLLSTAMAVAALPPGIPSLISATLQLASLTVDSIIDNSSYDRSLFPHWKAVEGTCNAREYILRRDGFDVSVGRDCYPTTGTWLCPFSGRFHSVPANVDIDHIVPLKNAWISGASSWTTLKRTQFANDISSPQLWAVDGNTNSAKGDKSPDTWKPPLVSAWCNYAKSWIQVKTTYTLSISAAEKAALTTMLEQC